MSRTHMLGQLPMALQGLPHASLEEMLELAHLLGGENGPAWRAHLRKTRRSGLPAIGTIVSVDRSVWPDYSKLAGLQAAGGLYSPAGIHLMGPAKYDLAKLDLWLHDHQTRGGIFPRNLYDYLKVNDLLSSCLNLNDLVSIQALGVESFKDYFDNKRLYAWKSVVSNEHGVPFVPYLHEWKRKLELGWQVFGEGRLQQSDVTPRFL